MRVLVAFEESHRSYGEAVSGAIRGMRPRAEVSVARAEDLGAEVARLAPHVVVCNRSNDVDPGGRAAWACLSEEPDVTSEFCVGGSKKRLENPGFGELLAFVDEAEELARNGHELRGC